ncbi:MAG: M20/M25/M40 family metallo-hydrolase [candidate division WOR-3 bacterium]|nr:M20/M25/M40 family metallo-hydrolase [candidate division WOR-3 bacterium]
MILLMLTGTMMLMGFSVVEHDLRVAELVDSVNPDSITAVIAGLSGEVAVTIEGEPDSIPCRFAYSEGAHKAARWLAEQFQARGFTVELEPFEPVASYEDRPLPIGRTEEEMKRIWGEARLLSGSEPFTMWNVVATLAGEDSAQVLLVAHYDATSEMPGIYTPGADDNASGVAGVLEAARIMGTHDWQHTLRFVLFSGEEVGLLGSETYVKDAVEAGDSMIAALNMDMIAYNNDDVPEMDIHCNRMDQASQDMGEELAELMDVYDLNINPEIHIYDAVEASDHYWFWQYDIPAVLFIEDFDDFNPFFHTTNDRLGKLDTAYMAEAVRLSVAWAASEAGLLPEEPGIEERIVDSQNFVSFRLSADVIRHGAWLEIRSPHAITPAIYDASGRQVKVLQTVRSSAEPVRITLDVSELPGGVYWIAVSGKDSFVSERFVLVR